MFRRLPISFKKMLVAVFAVTVALSVHSANVAWNMASLEIWEPITYSGYDFQATITYTYLVMEGYYSGASIVLRALPETNLARANSFVLAEKGDVVNAGYMNSKIQFFAHAKYCDWEDSETHTDYPLILDPGDVYYLAFSSESYQEPVFTYGWVELGYTTEAGLQVLASAWDRDGDSIVVGAIPEPTSGLLLLLGVAGLALKRKHA